MGEECTSIKILKKVPFKGDGDSLETRLRKVTLRGFPKVRVYEKSLINIKYLSSQEIMEELHTPQPHVYQDKLDRISSLRNLFQNQGIDILRLDAAYDFEATSEDSTRSYWTMLPPVIEKFMIPTLNGRNRFDYKTIIGEEVSKVLKVEGLRINKELDYLEVRSDNNLERNTYRLINDGSHRVHLGVISNKGINILEVESMTPGFPYYAAPQHYDSVKVIPKRDQTSVETKIHIVDAPVHKHLYRLFPSGGIMSGDVRPDKRLLEK